MAKWKSLIFLAFPKTSKIASTEGLEVASEVLLRPGHDELKLEGKEKVVKAVK